MTKKNISKLYVISLVLTGLVFSAALACIFLMGSTSRYMADDYCYAVSLRGNFWQRQVNAYLHETTFSGNRFSLTLFTGISELFGAGNIQVLPGIMLVVWLVCLYAFARQLPLLDGRGGISRLEALLAAETLELFTLGMANNWVQVYFWRAGMFPYLAPLVSGTAMMALLAYGFRKDRPGWLSGILIFLMAWITGGFSEVAVMVELALLGCGLFLYILMKKSRRGALLTFLPALAGGVLALVLIVASPMNQLRMQLSYQQHEPIFTTIGNALQGSLTFALTTLYRQTLYYASGLLFFFLLGWAVTQRLDRPALTLRQFTGWLLAAIGLAYLVITAGMLPGFYAESSYPSDRAQVILRFVSLLLALALGFLSGNFCSALRKKRLSSALLVLALTVVVLVDAAWIAGLKIQFHPPAYPEIRELANTHAGASLLVLGGALLLACLLAGLGKGKAALAASFILLTLPALMTGARFLVEYPLMKNRTALWDGREAQILQLRESGETDLVVPAMNSLAGILELSDNAGFWVNNCAADYYGVESLQAVEPVLDAEQLSAP